MNILETIVQHKLQEVKKQQATIGIEKLERYPGFSRQSLSLRESLVNEKSTGIIAEFKRRSPSKGKINDTADVIEVTTGYAVQGAAGLSVLTDEKFFGGSAEDLTRSRINEVPILRKDFMVDEYQFYEAKAIGADVVLLIAACLTVARTKAFVSLAKQLGLEVLLEIHNENELEHCCDGVDLIGVNNRNLKTFEVDIRTSLELIGKIPADRAAIAESGINKIETIVTLKEAGFRGFLIGENFMKRPDPSIAFAEFVQELKAKPV